MSSWIRVARSGAEDLEICLVRLCAGLEDLVAADEASWFLWFGVAFVEGAKEAGMKVFACGRRLGSAALVSWPPNLLPVLLLAT